MLRSEAVTRIQDWLGFRTDLESNIITALQDVQVELEGGDELPWFLLSEVSAYTTTVDEERISLPSNFLREWEGDHLWYFIDGGTEDDTWTPLLKMPVDQMRMDYKGSGPPAAYAMSGDYWRIGPKPDEIYTLKQIFYTKAALLTTDIENKWLKHAADLMIGRAGQKIATPVRDGDALAAFQAMDQKATNRLLIENIQYEHNNRSLQMGGPD